MLSKSLKVQVGSELYHKVVAFEDLGVLQGLFIKLNECIRLVQQGRIMGGEGSEFEVELMKLAEQARNEVSRATNKIIGIDEDTEIYITYDQSE